VFLSSGPTLSFRARGSDGVDVVLPGDHLPADGRFDLTVDVANLEAPATLWFITSRSRVALGECGAPTTLLVRDGLTATMWWRLELRAGSAPTAGVLSGDVLALTNPVYVAPGR
jgi:hypothetical protein